MHHSKLAILRTTLSWLLYYIGDLISRLMFRYDLGFLYTIYNRIMLWSADLDREGKVWKDVPLEED